MIRIMVVDDERDVEPLFRQRFRKEIRSGTIDFWFTFSAEAALDFLRSARAADVVLILSDINMPGMTGLELLHVLKEQFPHLRVFMITAYDEKENFEKAQAFGADDYLTKPIDFDRLKNAIFTTLPHPER